MTKEEILKGKTYLSLIKGEQKIVLIHDDVINTMQEYSDQQNKALTDEIEKLQSRIDELKKDNEQKVEQLKSLQDMFRNIQQP